MGNDIIKVDTIGKSAQLTIASKYKNECGVDDDFNDEYRRDEYRLIESSIFSSTDIRDQHCVVYECYLKFETECCSTMQKIEKLISSDCKAAITTMSIYEDTDDTFCVEVYFTYKYLKNQTKE